MSKRGGRLIIEVKTRKTGGSQYPAYPWDSWAKPEPIRLIYYFRIKSPNGRILCPSEGYHNKSDCRRAVARITQCGEWDTREG